MASIGESRPAGAGLVLYAAATAALGVVEAASRAPLPGLHQFEATGDAAAAIGLAMIALAALGLARRTTGAFVPLSLLWLAALVPAAAAAACTPRDLTSWVAPAELLVFALAALRPAAEALVATRQVAETSLRLALGGLLLLFGTVHLTHRSLIISLIPDWMPWSEAWPYVTGPALCLAGLALLSGRAVTAATLAVSGMFASWFVLIHGERIFKAPADAFEWTFGLTALALAGTVLMVSPPASAFSSRPT